MGTLRRRRSRDTQEDGAKGASERTRVKELHAAFATGKEVLIEHAQRRGSSLRDVWAASSLPPLAGLDTASSARTADRCDKSGVKEDSGLVKEAKERELAAWRKFAAFEQARQGAPSGATGDSRRVPTWKTLGGRAGVKALFVAEGFQDPDSDEGVVGKPRA